MNLIIKLYKFPHFLSYYCILTECPFKDECTFPKNKRPYVKWCQYHPYKVQHPEFEFPKRDIDGNII